jgi:hypothetical protein
VGFARIATINKDFGSASGEGPIPPLAHLRLSRRTGWTTIVSFGGAAQA